MTNMPLSNRSSRIEISVTLEPAANVLNSMALLSRTTDLPALDAWVARASATLSEQQRLRNRLTFACLEGALITNTLDQDFPAYLAALSAEPPAQLAARATAALPETAAPELPAEAQRLLADPPALHDLLVSHLSDLWETMLAGEWARARPQLINQVNALRGFLGHADPAVAARAAENLRSFVGAEAVRDIAGVQQVVYVPAPHNGRYVTCQVSGATVRLFFDAPRYYAAMMRATPIGPSELLARLGALNDEMRLRILELFAQQDTITAQEIMDRFGLTQSTTSRYLKQLSTFLAEGRGAESKKSYRLLPAQIDLTFQALRQTIAGDLTPGALPVQSETLPRDLRRFVDEQGRVTSWPSKERDKDMIFSYLASRFELDRQYTEKEVNTIISAHMHPDYQDFVTMRRELYNNGYLNRERDGSRYWREP